MIDGFTRVGAIVGFITGIFILWDRVLRARPITYVLVKGSKGNVFRYIRVRNVDTADIQVIRIKCWPKFFRVNPSHKGDNIALDDAEEAEIWKAFIAVIAYGEERDFPFGIRALQGWLNKIPFMTFFVFWRRSSSPLLPQLPFYRCTP